MKILGTITITDTDVIELSTLAAVILGWAIFCYMRGMFQAWRTDRPREFMFRTLEKLGPNFAGGDNAWQGALITDNPMDAIEGEILRAAVERYRARDPWPPVDGDRFRLVNGELCRI